MIYRKVSTHLALKSVQNLLKTGKHNRRDMEIAMALFRKNEGREMKAKEALEFIGA